MTAISGITSTANPGFAIGRQGATNPALSADCSVSSQATGVKVIGRAAASGADIVVTSSGTNETLNIDAKGSGAVNINATGTGDINLKSDTVVTGTLAASGDVAVNTDKFTVAATSGNVAAAGTLGVTGDLAVNTNKFTVTAASGNTAVAGTLSAVGDLAVNTDKFKVTASSGKVVAAGAIECQTSVKIGDVTLTEANLTSLLALLEG